MIRVLTADDVPAAVTILEQAGLAGAVANIGRYIRWQPDGCWGWFETTALRGTVAVLRHEQVGFVGCMAVDPAHQGRGLGRRLLEHAHATAKRAGITTFLLEATPQGEALYAQVDYVVEHETVIVARSGPARCQLDLVTGACDAIVALDHAATGSLRAPMIPGLVAKFPGAVVHAKGTVAGYGLVVGDRLGPVIARDRDAGRAIIDRLAPACTWATVPVPNDAAMSAVLANGFEVVRVLRRMRMGPPVPSRVDWIWTLASPGAG